MRDKIIIIIGVVLVAGLLVAGVVASEMRKNKENEPNPDGTSKVTATSILKRMTEADIKPSQDKLNIYLFWGDGCAHCKHLSEFLASIDSEYGKYYNIYSFEVWGNEKNKELMERMGGIIGEVPTGVPYLIIGDKTFSGYGDKMDAEIKQAIEEQFNKPQRFDAYAKLNNQAASTKGE